MPNRSLTYLSATFAGLVACYLLLVIGTVYLASSQTELMGRVVDKEASIGQLETRYYSSLSALTAADPASEGFVTPSTKLYARAAEAPALTRAGI